MYVKESGKDYVLANSVSSTHITEGHDLYWYTGTGQKHDNEHILLNYYIAGDFQNSTAAWDALEVYDYHRPKEHLCTAIHAISGIHNVYNTKR